MAGVVFVAVMLIAGAVPVGILAYVVAGLSRTMELYEDEHEAYCRECRAYLREYREYMDARAALAEGREVSPSPPGG